VTVARRDAEQRIRQALGDSAALMTRVADTMAADVARASSAVVKSLKAGGTLYCCGNGGSAADAQHIAAELGGKFYRVRPGLSANALTVNTSMLTAIGNDFGYEDVFARQLEGLGRRGDVLLAITTSGNSANVLRVAVQARAMKIAVIGLTGEGGGKLGPLCDHLLAVPAKDTARIQEAHIAIGHLLCEIVEASLFPNGGAAPARRKR